MAWPRWRRLSRDEEPEYNPNAIFVSYRRRPADEPWALMVRDAFARRFGDHAVFMDIRSIESGDLWRSTIIDAVVNSTVLIAVVGPDWNASDLHDEADVLLLELLSAIGQEIRIVPVTVGGASLPTENQLPPSLSGFLTSQAHDLHVENAASALPHLADRVDLILQARSPARVKAEIDALKSRIELLDEELRNARSTRVFISYSAADQELASALGRGLEEIGHKAVRRGAIRVTSDQTELLPGADLQSNIEKSLDDADRLVVLASPSAAASQWVDMELCRWLENKGRDEILVAVTGPSDGSPAWIHLPPALQDQHLESSIQFVDLRGMDESSGPERRDPHFSDGLASLAAAVLRMRPEELA